MSNKLHWTAGLHHDGSEVYVSNPLPKLGDTVTIKIRAPKDAPIQRIFLRTAPDGESHYETMKPAEEEGLSVYWAAPLKVTMPLNHYRFKILSNEGAYYYNGLQVSQADFIDYFDFKLVANFAAPSWIEDAVFYQIFPDRFYNGDPSNDRQVQDDEWEEDGFKTQRRQWGDVPLPWKESGSLDFFGGDLVGIQQKIDYLLDLGVNAIYLTPIFTSTSNHRYNIQDFFNVDVHLGGNDALIELSKALHDAGIRIILDITPNHSSSKHPWFLEAQKDPNAPSADYYTFYNRPDEYLAWLNVKTLPKLNYASRKLRDKMYNDPDSVMRYWLKPPFNIDGWRLDVYNMTAKQGELQVSHEVGQEMRRAVKGENPEAYLFGESFYDGTPNLQGDALDAIMDYRGFNMPLWRWLIGYDEGTDWRAEISSFSLMPSNAFGEQIARFRAAVPWVIARMQFHQLCSHDTTRILNIVKGDKSLVRLGVAMVMCYPGVPCVYYGDEIGMAGGHDPDNRRPMPWEESAWDVDLRNFYQQIIQLRKQSSALKHGGFQQLYAEDHLYVFQRQSSEQQLVIAGYRGPADMESVNVTVWHANIPDGAKLVDLLGGQQYIVKNGLITLKNLKKGDALVLEVRL